MVNPAVLPTTSPTPGPVILAEDTFQRPNQSLWGTASDGLVWSGAANSNPVYAISSQTGQINTHAANAETSLLGPSVTNAEVLFRGSASSYNGNNIGAVIRYQDDNNFYKADIGNTDLGSLLRVIKSPNSVIAQVPFTLQSGVNYTVRFRVTGSKLYAKVWQTGNLEPLGWMISATDTSVATGGIGLRVAFNNPGSATYTYFLAYQLP